MKNKKVNIIVTIVIIVLILLVGGIFFAVNYSDDESSLSIIEKKWICVRKRVLRQVHLRK